MALVYKATNKINGKAYIGMTIRTLNARKTSHIIAARNGNQCRFHHALRKYEEEDFIWEILHEDISEKEAVELEEQEILKHETHVAGKGYNGNTGKCGGFVVQDIETWKNNISKAVRGEGNPRYSGVTDGEIINEYIHISKKYGYIPSVEKFRKNSSIRIPKSFSKFRFNGTGSRGLVDIVKEKTGLPHKPHIRTAEHIEKIKKSSLGKRWYTNGKENILCREEHKPNDYYRGRTINA